MSADTISVFANAKINLHLDVLNRRQDGFHNIKSIFQQISIADNLLISKDSEKKGCTVFSPKMALEKENTLTKAYFLFKEETGIKDGITVRLLKNIPSGAGLGGGSSDAAALLKGLNVLFKTKLKLSRMKELAVNVGSDVPFFLGTSSALVTGRGERFRAVKVRNDCFGILICPEVFSSTVEAYSLLDIEKYSKDCNIDNPQDFCGKDITEWRFFNSFEKPLFKKYPEIKKAKQALLQNEADFALMSGAGSSVFGLYKSQKKAEEAYRKLKKQWSVCNFFILLAF